MSEPGSTEFVGELVFGTDGKISLGVLCPVSHFRLEQRGCSFDQKADPDSE